MSQRATEVLRVVGPGAQMLFQDQGRPGFAATGVSPSGAFDRRSARVANSAVGNDTNAAVLEILLGLAEFEVLSPTMVMLSGTHSPVSVIANDGATRQHWTHELIELSTGDRLQIGAAEQGLRSYLAIRGGFAVEEVLGSAAHDVFSLLGPPAVQSGDVLERGPIDPSWWPLMRQIPAPTHAPVELEVIPGPRIDWFTYKSQWIMFNAAFTVTPESNRIGIRTKGPAPLQRARTGELVSEGMVRGSIQVPPEGHPVVFGPDHPVTGGYPVIGVLTDSSCDRSAQLAPGDQVRFRLLQSFS